jgi:hypothetical protein
MSPVDIKQGGVQRAEKADIRWRIRIALTEIDAILDSIELKRRGRPDPRPPGCRSNVTVVVDASAVVAALV